MFRGQSLRALATSLAAWRYRGGARDERLDVLRGFAVLAMVVDHIGGSHSWLYAVTGGDHFVISAAEVFVLIAGLTMGMVYARLIASHGPAPAVRRALRRSATLYALTVALTVAFAGGSALLSAPWAPTVAPGGWPKWIAEVTTLQRTYYLTDIILMYAIVVAAAAPVFWLLARGHARAVLTASWLLWAAWQLAPGRVHVPWYIADNDIFTIAAWQVIFVTGIVVGYYRRAFERRLARLVPLVATMASGATVAAALVLLLLAPHPDGALPSVGGMVVSELGRKSDVPLARLVMLALLFTFAYSALTAAWRPLTRWTRWLLLPLGQHALLGYVAHLAVVLALGVVLPTWNVARSAGETALIQGAGLILVWGTVMLQEPALSLLAAARARRRAAGIGTRAGARAPALIPEQARGVMSPSAPVAPQRYPRRALASFALLSVLLSVLLATGLAGSRAVADGAPIPRGGVVTERSFESAALGRTMPYTLYLPPGYSDDDDARRYPVLYMLHGMGGNHTIEWFAYGLLERADALIHAGTIQPLIIVLPEGETSYWVDHADGGPAWGAYTAQDIVANIDAAARTIANPCARAIGGNSMGAHGAMQLALTYPGVFSIVGAHSPTLRSHEASLPYFGDETHFAEHDPRTLMATHWAAAQHLHWYIDAGEADPWLPAAHELHADMLRMQIPHEFDVRPGPHDNEYWIGQLDRYLIQYDTAFRASRHGC